MPATKAACCFVHAVGSPLVSCTATPTWGFADGDPLSINYACDGHLGHVLSDAQQQIQVWPLVDGYDPTLYSTAEIDDARRATEQGKHWPDCAINHRGRECDMGPECGSEDPAAQEGK